MNRIRFVVFAALLMCAFWLGAQQSSSKHFDTPKPSIAPRTPDPKFPVMLDNARVRVSRVEIAPAGEGPMLAHDFDYLLVSLGPAKLELAGTSNRFPVEMQDGEMQLIPGHWPHRFVNKTNETAHLVMIESRAAMKPDAALCGLNAERCHQMKFARDGQSEYEQSAMFETPTVRLVKASLAPGTILPDHEHGSDHLLIALNGVTITADHDDFSCEQGTVYWHKGGFASLKNIGREQARFLLLELK